LGLAHLGTYPDHLGLRLHRVQLRDAVRRLEPLASHELVLTHTLLGLAEIRALAADLGVRPTKTLGQNFVHDPNTIRRIVRTADLAPAEQVLEIGPGLGSLTLGLLAAGHPVVAVEIDGVLADALPATVAERLPGAPLT